MGLLEEVKTLATHKFITKYKTILLLNIRNIINPMIKSVVPNQ